MKMRTATILFAYDGEKVLLIGDGEPTVDKIYRPVEGELQPDVIYEDYTDNAFRRVKEETGIDLLKLTHLGLLVLTNKNETISTAYYAACLTNAEYHTIGNLPAEQQNRLCQCDTITVINSDVTDTHLAGDGALQFFVKCGLKVLGLSAK